MINSHFFLAGGLTILFTFIAAFYYYRAFFKKDIAVAVMVYGLLIFCLISFIPFDGNIGLGIGLLGILSLIRLRSTPENLIDISFIFYSIVLGLLNASIPALSSLLVVDLFLTVALIFFASDALFNRQLVRTQVIFDEIISEDLNDIDFFKKEIQKKYKITALNVHVKRIDYLKDSITLDFTYDTKNH